jgi:outer membrane protein OmpA-like peptidoglycan-associated protein/tetratricopeptide (TPR) repeat protein
MFLKKIIFVVLLILPFTLLAQEDIKFKGSNFPNEKSQLKSAKRQIKSGDYSMSQKNYSEALSFYLKANEFNPNNSELNYKIGYCYYHSLEKYSCLKYFKKAYELDNKVDSEIEYYLARGYHLNYFFDEAVKYYSMYLDHNSGSDKSDEVNLLIQHSKNGEELIKDSVDVEIINVGKEINSQFKEYRPLITADGSQMIFTSRRKGTTGGKIDLNDGEYYEDVYISDQTEYGWTRARSIGKPINTPEHDAVVGLSPDGQKLFVYKDVNGGDIYVSELRGSRYSRPSDISSNINSKYHESNACISPDGKTLYFVSDNPENSIGGRDIFYSKLDEDGNWSKRINIGTPINTKYDEEGVFIHPDGRTLYFSSTGHKTMGGYDIFKSVMDKNGLWSEPENIGYPINTPGDDVFFIISASGKTGYYSSFRADGHGLYDIYEIRYSEDKEEQIAENKDNKVYVTLLKGTIKDSHTMHSLEAKIEIIDNEKNETVANFISNSSTGKYLVSLPSGKNYGISVTKEGYLFHSENFNLPDTAEYQEVTLDILLQRIEVGTKVVLKNIFFDYDKSTLRAESTSELDRVVSILQKEPGIRIEISGHTDNRGAKEYNLSLSRDRAKTVVDYLISQGIESSRLEYKGYAFDEPIADNDTEEGRQLNRRVEFKVLSK